MTTSMLEAFARRRRSPTSRWGLLLVVGAAILQYPALVAPQSPAQHRTRAALLAKNVVDAEVLPKGSLQPAEKVEAPKGKVAIITGAASGVGLATVEGMARSGKYSTIIMAGRDAAKHQSVIGDLQAELTLSSLPVPKLVHMQLDLDSLASVRNFTSEFQKLGLPLHTLLLNAGVMALPKREVTEDGYEYQFGVNHLGHFLLSNLLLDSMVASASPKDPARVIALSSSAHRIPSPLLKGDLGDLQSQDYSPWVAYGQSKLANLLFVYEFDRRVRERGLPVAVNAVHPGVVNTPLFKHVQSGAMNRLSETFDGLLKPVKDLVTKTPKEGARTSVRLATEKDGKTSGRFWQDERPAPSAEFDLTGDLPEALRAMLPIKPPRLSSYDPDTWGKLWQRSETLVGLTSEEVSAWRQQ